MNETVFAHRGCAGHYPENTLLAVRKAAPHVGAFEIDVRRCGSGELVVHHDADLERLTGTSGRVSDTDLADLRELEVLGSGERIPTLTELLDAVPDAYPVNVELKEAGLADDALEICGASPNPVLYSSFLPDALRELQAADGSARLAVLTHEKPAAAIELATALDAAAVHPSVGLCATTDVVADAHGRGFDVNAWTAATAADVRTMREAGVDGIITDRWDVV